MIINFLFFFIRIAGALGTVDNGNNQIHI
jgi:hypothetical protein